jgi:hypothetical protein
MVQKKYKNKKANTKVAEPPLQYGVIESERELHFFTSFEEMNDADLAEMADMSPEESLMNATLMIKQAFSEELKEKCSDYTIIFK